MKNQTMVLSFFIKFCNLIFSKFYIFSFFLLFQVGYSQLRLIPISPDSLQKRLHSPGETIKIVNFWATWCVPCREEFPDLIRIYQTYKTKGVELLFVSTDFPEDTARCLKFLQKQGVTWNTYWKQGKDQDFIDAITPQWSGALPFTAIYDTSGNLIFFHEGKISYQTLQHQVEKLLNLNPNKDHEN